MIYDPFQFFCYYYTEVVKHDPKAPLPGELSAKLTERLSQICRERPKPQIQFAVWKGRNEHRGKETSLAAAPSVVVVSDVPPAAPSFPSCRKRRGRKGALGYVWCFLRLSLGKPQCFGLAFHSVVTLRASWYAPPDTRVPNLQLVALEQFPSNRRCVGNPDGCYLLAGQIVGAGLCSARG